jgi:phage FluMu gp28-like protein
VTDAPPVLLPYQQAWIADHSALKVMEKSRRTGVTWAEAADNVLTAAASRGAGGQNVYYIAYNQDMTVEYVQACAMWARAFNHAASEIEEGFWEDEEEDKHIKTFTIRFPSSGFRVVALTSRPSNLRGRQGLIVIDEAAFHEQLGELLKAAMAMLIWGGSVHVISTHNGVDNPFNALVQDIRAQKRSGTVHRVDFREAVEQGLFRRVCLRNGTAWSEAGEQEWMADLYAFYGDGAAEELDCVPSMSGGAWLSRALIESHMADAPVLRWKAPASDFALWPEHLRTAEMREWLETHALPVLLELDPALRSGFGMDFGRSGDLSVLLPFQIDQRLTRRFPFALELSDCPFDQQREALFYIGERLPRLFAGQLDARGNGQYLAEKAVQKWGAGRIEAVMLSLAWYRDNSAPFKAALEDGTVELVRDADHLADLRAFEVVKGIPLLPDTRTKGQDGRQRHGDAGVAYLLAYAASRSEGLAVTEGFQSIPRRPGRDDDEYEYKLSRRMF